MAEQLAPTMRSFTTIAELRSNWRQEESNVARVPLAARTPLPSNAKTSLMGFDMGEFQFDPWFTKWSQGACGAEGNRSAANVYNFSFWQYVDISYYYGHQLLTVPPTVWTNAAHKNGVLSLGTLGLNWYEQENVGKFDLDDVKAMLTKRPAQPDPKRMYLEECIDVMKKIAGYYGFDGYLVNFEPEAGVNLSAFKPGMMQLLSALKTAGLTMLWYDSTFSSENGFYDNRLTGAQYEFFTAANNFQANYFWGTRFKDTEKYPQLSWEVLKAKNSATALDDRKRVFMAVDCSKDRRTPPYESPFFFQTLALINSSIQDPPNFFTGLGLYYPAWVMYDLRFPPGDKVTDKLPDRETFHNNDEAFWCGTKDLIDFPKPHEGRTVLPNECMSFYLHERSVIRSAPFVTTFNDGEGLFYNVAGETLSKGPWNNLSDQSVLPSFRYKFANTDSKTNKTKLQYTDPATIYTGGSSLSIDLSKIGVGGSLNIVLFRTEFKVTPTSTIGLVAKFSSSKANLTLKVSRRGFDTISIPVEQSIPLENGWTRYVFDLNKGAAEQVVTVIGLNIEVMATPTIFTIGELALLDSAQRIDPSPIMDFPGDSKELDWSKNFRSSSHYRVYGVLGKTSYLLGIAYNCFYRTKYETWAGVVDAVHIFNTEQSGFTSYKVQEITADGNYTPL
ncbi:hypothetical protein CU048_06795 [Beijerinckiaceae bacterium]|nr:hypothetical protein CU048_06795 [Beijerinckiaceae bacterium]